jgi:hypothetical protein
MSDYNLLLQPMSEFSLSSTRFTVFIPGPVTTGFLRFFAVPVHSSWILKLSGTGPVHSSSKKGNRTETGLDFKALLTKLVCKSRSSWWYGLGSRLLCVVSKYCFDSP